MHETIFYESPIGFLKISAEDDAIISLHFINEPVAESQLNIVSGLPVLNKCKEELDRYFAGKNFNFVVKIKQYGTAFQHSVWSGLLQIKPGTVTNYLQLSKKLGNPKAIRAVGLANGKNTIAIIVPCHRVIGSNGKLVGYAGELWRKQWLLEHEAKHLQGKQTLFN